MNAYTVIDLDVNMKCYVNTFKYLGLTVNTHFINVVNIVLRKRASGHQTSKISEYLCIVFNCQLGN